MSLMDQVREQTGDEGQAQVEVQTGDEGQAQVEVQAGGKKSNSEYQKRIREQTRGYIANVKEYFESHGGVPEELREAMDFLCRTPRTHHPRTTQADVMEKLFGPSPAVGAKVTIIEVLERTGKGFAEMRTFMKKAASSGIVIEYNADERVYTITSISQ